MTEKSKLFGYVGRWILTVLIQIGKMLSGTFSLAATGVGFLSATSQQHGMCYSSYYISNTLCSILVVINHWVNREFPWNKSARGYFDSCYFVSQFLFDFATFSQIAVCMYTPIRRENDQQLGVSKALFLLSLLCFQPSLINQRKPKLCIVEGIF